MASNTFELQCTRHKQTLRTLHAKLCGRTWQFRIFLIALMMLMASGASGAPQRSEIDPWQSMNRAVFRWNDYFDKLLVRPAAFAYTTFLPRAARQGVGNFFSNLNDVNVLANDVLQLKGRAIVNDSSRLVLNTTLGIGGVFDVASSAGLRKNEEDFGQTLAAWGVGTGPYVMLPVFGASNLRDSAGLVLDTLLNPIQRVEDRSLRVGLFVLIETDARSGVLALDELITGDRYLFVRDAYMQRREFLVSDGMLSDPFGDF